MFEVGKTYATRGGDRVRRLIRNLRPDAPEMIQAVFLDGANAHWVDMWMPDGRYVAGEDRPHDLLPGALPEPAAEGDRVAELEAENARLREALEKISAKCPPHAKHEDEDEPDFDSKYFNKSDDYARHVEARGLAAIGDIARAALQPEVKP